MRKPLLAALALLTLLLAAGTAEAATRRIALVIGNDSYDNVPDLAKARNDARAVATRSGATQKAVQMVEPSSVKVPIFCMRPA